MFDLPKNLDLFDVNIDKPFTIFEKYNFFKKHHYEKLYDEFPPEKYFTKKHDLGGKKYFNNKDFNFNKELNEKYLLELVNDLNEIGFKNIELFDPTFYESHEITRAQREGESRYDAREKMGQIRPFSFKERNINLKTTNMFQDFVTKINTYKPDIIFASIVEDTFPIFINFMELIKNKKKLLFLN